MTKEQVEELADKIATDCVLAFNKASVGGPINDHDIHQIIVLRVENELAKAALTFQPVRRDAH